MFLDEVGDMSPATQSKVLRLLQEQSFERLGGNEAIQVNVRVLCAPTGTWKKPSPKGNSARISTTG